MADPILMFDRAVGDRLEHAVCAHHRRRLKRIGWARALDPDGALWAGGDPPPRAGNAIEVLVDGEEALPRLAAEIESAQSHVHLAGWHFDAGLDLGPARLRDLLAGAAERVDVRVLAWAGAPLPLFHPSRSEVRESRDRLVRGTGISFALDAKERPMHCHHEKLAIVDGRVAYLGGIDLTKLGGDRFDRREHPRRGSIGWHDVASRIEGPLIADVGAHFALRWREVTGETLAAPEQQPEAGSVELQLVRTVPEKIYEALPRGDFRILEAYVRALRSAQRLVYLESQFLWSPELVEILVDKLRRPPSDEFRLVVLLPAKPNNGNDDTRGQLAVLVEADGGAGRFLACTLSQRGPGARPVYVHAKVGIVDDRWLTLGSANLNDHSLFNDTEVNLVTCDEELARATRLRLWAEHLERDDVDGDTTRLVDEVWRPLAEEQLERRRAGQEQTHRLSRLPHVSRRSRRLLGPLDSLFVDG